MRSIRFVPGWMNSLAALLRFASVSTTGVYFVPSTVSSGASASSMPPST